MGASLAGLAPVATARLEQQLVLILDLPNIRLGCYLSRSLSREPLMFENALGAQFRRFENREHLGKPARVVVAVRTYDTDREDLWDALTSRERLAAERLARSTNAGGCEAQPARPASGGRAR